MTQPSTTAPAQAAAAADAQAAAAANAAPPVPITGPSIEVLGRAVGPGRPTFVIAEIGVNHDGDVQKAIKLVKAAAACGADAVKLQVFRATVLMHPDAKLAKYQKAGTDAEDPIEMLRKYELTREDLRAVVRAILESKMVPLATPFSPGDVDTLAGLRVPAVKIASPDLVNRPLLDEAVKLNKPLLVSTGAATLDEVRSAAAHLTAAGAKFAFLHCVSDYPVDAADAHLGWIAELTRAFPNVPVGYSDHTTHPMAGALAVAAGACAIEKHLTLDRSSRGPDHAASADPTQFERYVKLVREADGLRGSGDKRVLACEEDVRTVSRQSLVLRRSLAAGEVIRATDLTVQRPGTGVSAERFAEVVGRAVTRPVSAGAMLQSDMIASGEATVADPAAAAAKAA